MWALLVLFLLRFPLLDSVAGAINLKRPFNNSIPAVLVFGDSTVDPGNNNHVATIFRSNFAPYGRDFVNSTPTGRFSDGRLVTDLIASYVGIKENVPPYLQPGLSIQDLMTGVSFASAGSGFDPLTAGILVIPIRKQLEYFREYKRKLEVAIGKERAKALIKKSAFVVSAGTNDLVINYYGTPLRRITYNLSSYLQFLLQNVQQFIQGLREEGAELIAVVGLPPIGCIPIVITLTAGGVSTHHRPCADSLSSVALDYNHKLQKQLTSMQINSSSILVYADIYQTLNDLIQKPAKFGFDKASTGCCGTGLVETTFLCNPKSPVCPNPSKYVFFDSVHPSEASYKYIFEALRPTIDQVIKNYHL